MYLWDTNLSVRGVSYTLSGFMTQGYVLLYCFIGRKAFKIFQST